MDVQVESLNMVCKKKPLLKKAAKQGVCLQNMPLKYICDILELRES
jgi:hypothetical protein